MAMTEAKAQEHASIQEQDYSWTYAHGRRYAASELGHYYMPNDEPEIHRLNMQHLVLTQARGGTITAAPVLDKGQLNMLDIGCGSGIWCVQMAEDYPSAHITGLDISPVQPTNKPNNVEWLTLDFENDAWPFPLEHFDLIHLSLVHGCVQDWPRTVAKMVHGYVKPGGFIEHQEFAMGEQYFLDSNGERILSSQLKDTCAFARWPGLMNECSEARGRTIHLGPKLKGWQEHAGLVGVTQTIIPLPVGTWPTDPQDRRIGEQFMTNVLNGIDGFTMALFTRVLGWTEQDTKTFIEQCKDDLKNDKLRKMLDLYVVYGQKPT